MVLIQLAGKFNDLAYFTEDPVTFPRRFAELSARGEASAKDVEVAGLLSAHLAWGRRSMIVRDCNRMFEQMDWKPYDYVMRGKYRDEDASLHRTVKWSEFSAICSRMRDFYNAHETLERTAADDIRTLIFGQKSDLKAANKKIHLFRRWMVRRDGIVDIGLWRGTDPAELIIPLDTHVHTQAREMGITERNATDFRTASQITDYFRHIFPDDPCLGDFALFGLGVTGKK
ncbi:MAG: TIGR02757 family protein [Bacteroidales bacterium]|nr:TIGR02757 family protein [Candidatus Cacconaster merdequi]